VINARCVGATLLELHSLVDQVDLSDFHAAAFALLRREISFDAGIWGTGAMVDGEPRPHHVYLDRLGPELMASWEAVKGEDVLVGAALARPGEPVSSSLSDAAWDNSPGVRAHCRRHGIEHVLCTFVFDALTGLYHVLSLYRGPQRAPFGLGEQHVKRVFTPHLVRAGNAMRRRQMWAAAAGTARTHLAVMDREGVVYQAEQGFLTLMEREWPAWHGPRLPERIVALGRGGRRFVGREVAVAAAPMDDLFLLSMRRAAPADRLSARELEIARHYGQGSCHKRIAQQLGISPVTVRNHLRAIYDKLGVADKARLATELHALGLES